MIVICPETGPLTTGLNTMPMAQLAPPAREPLTVPPACGQVVFALVSSAKGPVNPTEVKERGLAWKLVTVNSFVGLVAPRLVAANATSVGGLSVSGATPFPNMPTVCVPPASLITVSVPAGAAPSALGVRVTCMLQLLPAARAPGFGHGADGAVTRA